MLPHLGKFIAYFRVSPTSKASPALGLEAQREAVLDYLNGGRWTLVAGIRRGRERQAERSAPARRHGGLQEHKAKLVIAKLDRLSRNLAFIATLMDSGVEFVAVDNPHANKLTSSHPRGGSAA